VPKGSYSTVESLDRISRQTVHRDIRRLRISLRLNVVDLEDPTLDTDGIAFLIMVIRFMRA
jgi:hypothetical protein